MISAQWRSLAIFEQVPQSQVEAVAQGCLDQIVEDADERCDASGADSNFLTAEIRVHRSEAKSRFLALFLMNVNHCVQPKHHL